MFPYLPKSDLVAMAAGLLVGLLTVILTGNSSIAMMTAVGTTGGMIIWKRRKEKAQKDLPSDDPADQRLAITTATMTLPKVRAEVEGIANEEARDTLLRALDSLDRAVAALADPDKLSAAPRLLDGVIEPMEASVTEYTWLATRDNQAARDRMARIAAGDFPTLEYAARTFATQLERAGKPDIAALDRATTFQLDPQSPPAAADPSSWGNRQRLVEQAEREKGS